MAAHNQPQYRRVNVYKGPSLLDLSHALFCFVPNSNVTPVFYAADGEYRMEIIGTKQLNGAGTKWIFFGYRGFVDKNTIISWNKEMIYEIHYNTASRKGHIRIPY